MWKLESLVATFKPVNDDDLANAVWSDSDTASPNSAAGGTNKQPKRPRRNGEREVIQLSDDSEQDDRAPQRLIPSFVKLQEAIVIQDSDSEEGKGSSTQQHTILLPVEALLSDYVRKSTAEPDDSRSQIPVRIHAPQSQKNDSEEVVSEVEICEPLELKKTPVIMKQEPKTPNTSPNSRGRTSSPQKPVEVIEVLDSEEPLLRKQDRCPSSVAEERKEERARAVVEVEEKKNAEEVVKTAEDQKKAVKVVEVLELEVEVKEKENKQSKVVVEVVDVEEESGKEGVVKERVEVKNVRETEKEKPKEVVEVDDGADKMENARKRARDVEEVMEMEIEEDEKEKKDTKEKKQAKEVVKVEEDMEAEWEDPKNHGDAAEVIEMEVEEDDEKEKAVTKEVVEVVEDMEDDEGEGVVVKAMEKKRAGEVDIEGEEEDQEDEDEDEDEKEREDEAEEGPGKAVEIVEAEDEKQAPSESKVEVVDIEDEEDHPEGARETQATVDSGQVIDGKPAAAGSATQPVVFREASGAIERKFVFCSSSNVPSMVAKLQQPITSQCSSQCSDSDDDDHDNANDSSAVYSEPDLVVYAAPPLQFQMAPREPSYVAPRGRRQTLLDRFFASPPRALLPHGPKPPPATTATTAAAASTAATATTTTPTIKSPTVTTRSSSSNVLHKRSFREMRAHSLDAFSDDETASPQECHDISSSESDSDDAAQSDADKQSPATSVKERVCVFCSDGEQMDEYDWQLTLITWAYDQHKQKHKRKRRRRVGLDLTRGSYWVHNICLATASRQSNETDVDVVRRVLRHAWKCYGCGRPRASMGCMVPKCMEVYHYKCARRIGALVDGALFYCTKHERDAIQKCKAESRWPEFIDKYVKYTRANNWSGISDEIRQELEKYCYVWEFFDTDSFWSTCLLNNLEVREIDSEHWAWCSQLASKGFEINGHTRQYEAIARHSIAPDDIIGEYVGRVRSVSEHPESKYMAQFWMPEGMPEIVTNAQLCIDAHEEGNETRFINSVTPSTPSYIRQNATMNTVWSNGQLRILISATRHIRKGEPVVLNYNEHESTYFEETDEPAECYVWISRAEQGRGRHSSKNRSHPRLPRTSQRSGVLPIDSYFSRNL